MHPRKSFRTFFATLILIVACFAPIELQLTKEQRARIAESLRQDLHPAIIKNVEVQEEEVGSQVVDRTGQRKRVIVVRNLPQPEL